MKRFPLRRLAAPLRISTIVCVFSTVLGGCATSLNRAPVEDRGVRPSGLSPTPAPAPVSVDGPKLLPGAEYAGKPGYYSVKPGDTLIRVGMDSGQSWRDIARWNNLDNPNLLEVGQVLRVVAPGSDASVTAARAIVPTRVEARPLEVTVVTSAAAASSPPPAVAAPSVAAANTANTAAAAPATATATAPAPATPRDDEVLWSWPVTAAVAAPFDEARSKGLTFAGKAGDPVLAAGDGRVIYVGSGVRGYGNLVIVKHNNTYLTAYAHNQMLLVKEDQVVRRGQKIAEMGSSDAERVQLHFEIRKLGKPVDPARLLPAR